MATSSAHPRPATTAPRAPARCVAERQTGSCRRSGAQPASAAAHATAASPRAHLCRATLRILSLPPDTSVVDVSIPANASVPEVTRVARHRRAAGARAVRVSRADGRAALRGRAVLGCVGAGAANRSDVPGRAHVPGFLGPAQRTPADVPDRAADGARAPHRMGHAVGDRTQPRARRGNLLRVLRVLENGVARPRRRTAVARAAVLGAPLLRGAMGELDLGLADHGVPVRVLFGVGRVPRLAGPAARHVVGPDRVRRRRELLVRVRPRHVADAGAGDLDRRRPEARPSARDVDRRGGRHVRDVLLRLPAARAAVDAVEFHVARRRARVRVLRLHAARHVDRG